MPEYFISRTDAEKDLLSCATYLAERITSIDGHAEAMIAVVPQYISKGNVDLAAELSNTVDDPHTRDRLLIAVSEKCAATGDDEYALQLAEAVEEPGLQSQALERVALQKASQGEFEKAREIASSMAHPDRVLTGIAVKQNSMGLDEEANATIEEIEHAGAAVTALIEIAMRELQEDQTERAIAHLESALDECDDIEHMEERAWAFCDIGSGFLEAGRNDRAIVAFDSAKATAETLDNMHRDTFLSLAAQGFLRAGSVDLADRTLDLVTDKTQMASCLLGYSREFWRKDEREEAIEALEEAYAILESQHERETRDHKSRFRLFTSIAAQFAGFEKGERAIEIAEKIQDEGQRTSALSQIAGVLTLRKEDDEARHAFRAITEDGDRVFALIGMSDAKEKNEDRTGAIAILNEAMALTETVPQLTMRASAYSEVATRLDKYGESAASQKAFADAIETISQLRDESARVTGIATLAQTGIEPEGEIVEMLRPLLVRQAAQH